jgi:hypothetical protein
MFAMKTRLALTLTTLSLVLISACAKQEQVREIDWAKAALARNPTLEIIATDESAGVFTVRDTSNGSTLKLRLEDLVAGPLPASPRAVAPAAPEPPAVEPAATPGEEAAPLESVAAVPSSTGTPLAEGPGYSITRGEVATPAPVLEGPGYSITREGPRGEPATQQSTPDAESIVSNAERRTDPIICQGDRLMRIDGETIDFEGDAVIAEKGCDLYISNARISAGGVGIIARQARVHIVNSTIGGTRGSYEASDGAEMYVARSTFSGVGRRFDNATMNDLGGNEYKLTH